MDKAVELSRTKKNLRCLDKEVSEILNLAKLSSRERRRKCR